MHTISSAARTHLGHVRDGNEDTGLARPERGVFAVADGMGGHAAGEVASALAVDAVVDRLVGDPPGAAGRVRGAEDAASGSGDVRASGPLAAGDTDVGVSVAEAVREANRRILEAAREDPSHRGMGTTLTVLTLPTADRWVAGHVGDSRLYLHRPGELRQLSEDHTIAPGSSTLTRALGTRESVEVDVMEDRVEAGDAFLLCSDGLTDMLSDDWIREVLDDRLAGGEADPEGAARRLVEQALERGGHDNVTVVVVRPETA